MFFVVRDRIIPSRELVSRASEGIELRNTRADHRTSRWLVVNAKVTDLRISDESMDTLLVWWW